MTDIIRFVRSRPSRPARRVNLPMRLWRTRGATAGSGAGVVVHLRTVRGLLTVAIVALALWIQPAASIQPATLPAASTPGPAPQPTSSSIPSGAPTSQVSGPIVVSSDDTTLDGTTISTSNKDGTAIKAWGTPSSPIRNLTIRNCRIKGFGTAIEARYVTNLVVENCVIEDAAYGGIIVYSGVGGRITGNTIRRIGVGIDVNGPDENNAYGIALSRIGTSNLTTEPRSSDFTVENNVVEDVPLWHGIDTHAGSNIAISNNTVRRCARAIFITVDNAGFKPQEITVTGNRLEEAVHVPGGTNTTAITMVNLQGGTIANNFISSTYEEPWVYDYLGIDPAGSKDVVISGQEGIP
jgi:hypothetical protein